MGKMVKFAALLIGAASLQGCAIWDQINTSRAYNYLVVSHASHHVDAQREFREKNLGIGFGSEAPVKGNKRLAVGLETGLFENSLEHWSTYVAGYWEYDVLGRAPRRLRMGGFLGMAEYPSEAGRTSLPTAGDYIMVGGLQATIPTTSNHEFRVRLAPGLNQSGPVFTLQSNFKF